MLFGINRDKYETLEPIEYDGIYIPAGFVFDGVTVKAPFTMLFSNKDLRQGIRASCFHDYLCQHKDTYSREYATKILVEIWKEDGLEWYKAKLVSWAVNAYQWFYGWR